MHIGFRTSGGRGEYEVVGSHSGFNASDLDGWQFSIRWPDGQVRDSGLWLDPGDSGKPRLRSVLEPPFQIGRICAAMLMLPDPRREVPRTGSSWPVASHHGFVLTQVGFGEDTEFAPAVELVTIDPTYISLLNMAYAESIGVAERWSRVVSVYEAMDVLPDEIRGSLVRHQEYMSSGRTVQADLTATVERIGRALELVVPGFVWTEDCLDTLETMCGIETPDGPTLPSPDQLPPDAPEVNARSAAQYRLAKVRGPGQAKFSLALREAWRHRCAFCGGRFGGIAGMKSGLEAAHILAWSRFDLDILQNGMALCKTHHWAFDAGLMLPVYDNGTYRLRFTELSGPYEPASVALLGSDGFEIPEEWLPADPQDRPHPDYLKKLQEDLAVVFLT